MAGRGRGNSYKDEFESHDYKPHQSYDNGNPKLHVTNIPIGVDEKGLSNIFSAECAVPERVYISKTRKNSYNNTSWGFVEFKTVSDAQHAILAVNKKPPYELSLQFSKDGNKDHRDKSPHENQNHGRGRGYSNMLMKDQPSSNNFRSPRANDESFNEEIEEVSSTSRFSSKSTHADQAVSKVQGLPIEKYSHVEISDEMDLHVAAYVGNRAKDLTIDDLSTLCSEIKLALPFKPGQCCYCHRTAIYTCSRCKSWYCSDFCRMNHWPQHKDHCHPRTVAFQKDGTVMYKDVPDAFCAEDSNRNQNYNSRSPRVNNGGRNFRPDSRNDVIKNNFNHDNRSDQNYDANFENFKDGSANKSQENNSGGRNNFKMFDQGSGRSNHDQGGGRRHNHDQDTGRPNQNQGDGEMQSHDKSNGRFNQRRGGGDRHGGNRRGGNHSEEKFSVNNGMANDEPITPNLNSQNILGFSKLTEDSEATTSEEKKKNNKIISLFGTIPIPPNKYTQVTIGALGTGGEFWAYKLEDYVRQGSLMTKLNSYATSCGPLDSLICVGNTYIAPYQGDWYRGEVIKIFQETVEVIFIDFGNESEVRKSDLKPLPDSFISQPPMAFKYKIPDYNGQPLLKEDTNIFIKPLTMDKEGRCLVDIETVQNHGTNVDM